MNIQEKFANAIVEYRQLFESKLRDLGEAKLKQVRLKLVDWLANCSAQSAKIVIARIEEVNRELELYHL